MIIEIKRATVNGLVPCEGTFFEYKYFQFCLVKQDGWYFCIELESGGSVITYDDDLSFDFVQNEVKSGVIPKYKDMKEAIEKFKKVNSQFTYPINKQI